MKVMFLISALLGLAIFSPAGWSGDKPPEQTKSDGKDKADPSAVDPPATFELGDRATLGDYSFATPAGWTAADMKDNKFAAMYRSQDKAAVIRVQVRPKAAVSPEAVPKYAPTIIQKLKQDFLKNKTEIIEPPTVQKDPRFFLTIREVIKIKEGKIAAQSHLYLMPGKDLIELTVITTSTVSDEVAATEKLAQEMLLSCKGVEK
jgi:hypothetical protein